MTKQIKIGDLNYVSPDYGAYETSFHVTSKVKEYLENEKLALACLLPDAWQFYECELFDYLDFGDDGRIDKNFSKTFMVVYNKITVSMGWTESKGLTTKGFEEEVLVENGKEILYSSGKKLISSNKSAKEFIVNYLIIGDKRIVEERNKREDRIVEEFDEDSKLSSSMAKK